MRCFLHSEEERTSLLFFLEFLDASVQIKEVGNSQLSDHEYLRL